MIIFKSEKKNSVWVPLNCCHCGRDCKISNFASAYRPSSMSLRDVPIVWADSGRSLSSTLCDLVRAWKIISQLSKGQVLLIDIPVLVSPFQGKTISSWPCSEGHLLQLETTLVAERRASAASISSWQYKVGWIDSSTNSDYMVPHRFLGTRISNTSGVITSIHNAVRKQKMWLLLGVTVYEFMLISICQCLCHLMIVSWSHGFISFVVSVVS